MKKLKNLLRKKQKRSSEVFANNRSEGGKEQLFSSIAKCGSALRDEINLQIKSNDCLVIDRQTHKEYRYIGRAINASTESIESMVLYQDNDENFYVRSRALSW